MTIFGKTKPAVPSAPARAGAGAPTSRKSLRRSKAERFVLLIGDEGAILVYVKGRQVQRRLFAPSSQPEHVKTMLELMDAHPGVSLRILVDSIDQQFVRQTFPPVSALGISKLVSRRLARDFPPEDLKGALRIGREKGGRQEWNYLLIALANTPHLQGWLQLMLEQENRLLGVYLTPVEAQHYYPAIVSSLPQRSYEGSRTSWKLMVSHHKVGGFRQVVLKDGKLAFTRLSPSLDDAVPAVLAGNIEQEILNSIEYIRRLGYEENATLEILVIAAQEVKDALDLNRFEAAGAYTLTPLEVAGLLQLDQAALSADRYGDVVLASFFAVEARPALLMMSRYGRQLAQMYQARHLGRLVAGVLVVLMGMAALSGLTQFIRDRQTTNDFVTKREGLQPKLAKLKNAISEQDVDTSLKSAVIAAKQLFEPDRYLPFDFIAQLVPELGPEVTVNSIDWQRKELPGGDNQNAVAALPDGPLSVVVEFELIGSYADQEQLAKAAEAFFEKLKLAFPNYNLTGDKLPGKTGVAERTQISFGDSTAPAIETGQNLIRISFAGPRVGDAP